MPEVPELEVFESNLKKLTINRSIQSMSIIGKNGSATGAKEFCKNLMKQSITDITRHGKELLFSFSNNSTLGVHLMLRGGFEFHPAEDDSKSANIMAEIRFSDESRLYVVDQLRLCQIKVNPVIDTSVPDVLSGGLTLEVFIQLMRSRPRSKIGAVLVDQKIILGIGRAYADEILWFARVSPLSVASRIPDAQLEDIFHSMRNTLTWAVGEIRKETPDAIKGEGRPFLNVHGLSDFDTEGNPIKTEKIDGRLAYYSDKQILYE